MNMALDIIHIGLDIVIIILIIMDMRRSGEWKN